MSETTFYIVAKKGEVLVEATPLEEIYDLYETYPDIGSATTGLIEQVMGDLRIMKSVNLK